MDSIQLSIISTLALYSAEGRGALTAGEIYLYRHKSKDIDNHIYLSFPRKRESSNIKLDMDPSVREDDKIKKDYGKPTEKEISDCLSELVNKNLIFNEGNHYSLENRPDLSEENTKKARQSAEKIKKNKWPLMLLRSVPFARAIAITGSISMQNARPKSDLDLLIITKKGRIWTTRIFALLIIELFGRRRENAKKTEKICLNFFIAEGVLAPIQNIASANMLRRAIPLFGERKYYEWLAKNRWMEQYINSSPVIPIKPGRSRHNIFEYFLSGKAGNWLEQFFKDWQYRRLAAKITAPQNLEHFILTDEILMLHYPDPKNKKVMEKYERIISEFS